MCVIDFFFLFFYFKGSGFRLVFVRGECGGYEKFWDVYGFVCVGLNYEVWFCLGKNVIIFVVIFRVR